MKLLATALAASLLLAGCASSDDPVAQAESPCGPTPAVDLTTPEGWIGQIPALSESTSLVIDNGQGTVVEHRPDAVQPLASAVKVVHLAAYAQAVAAGRLDPNEQIPMIEWERWYAPGTDAGAHLTALKRLGIADDGVGAADIDSSVRLDDMISAMIQESDNSVPDYLRHRLGDQALIDAAAAGGWSDFQVPTLIGTNLASFDPARPTEGLWELAQRFAYDQAFRESYSASLASAPIATQVAFFADNGPMGSADQLTSMYRSIVTGSFGPGTDTIRRQLEWHTAPDGFTSMGFKGGNVPGVLTEAFEFTRPDGSTATAVWLISGMNEEQYDAATANFANQQVLMIQAVGDQNTLERIACAA